MELRSSIFNKKNEDNDPFSEDIIKICQDKHVLLQHQSYSEIISNISDELIGHSKIHVDSGQDETEEVDSDGRIINFVTEQFLMALKDLMKTETKAPMDSLYLMLLLSWFSELTPHNIE